MKKVDAMTTTTKAGGRDASGGLDRTRYLTLAEVKRLRRAVKDRALADMAEGRTTWVKNWMMIDLGLQTGLRVAEMTGLTVGDIDLKLDPDPGNGMGRRADDPHFEVLLNNCISKRASQYRTHCLPASRGQPIPLVLASAAGDRPRWLGQPYRQGASPLALGGRNLSFGSGPGPAQSDLPMG